MVDVRESPSAAARPRRCSARSSSRSCGVAPESIERALEQAARGGRPARRGAARACKLIDEDQLALALALQSDMPYLRDLPRAEDIPVELIDKLPINFARQRLVLPLGRDGTGRVMVAVADPHAVDVIDAVAVLLAEPVEPVVASSDEDHRPHQQDVLAAARAAPSSRRAAKKDDDAEDERVPAPKSSSTCSTPTTRRRSSAG